MPHQPEDNNPDNWHRFFAMDGNNRGWTLAALASRTREQREEMLNSAHASAFHWSAVGNQLNTMRARTLLAEVHALCGFGASALELADEVRSYFLPLETDDWELAFVHTIHAHAAAVAGAGELHRASYETAKAAINAIADDEDRRIVLMTFEQVPLP